MGIIFALGIVGPWLAFAIYLFLYAVVLAWKVLQGDWKEIEV